jgi:hypothetical protein
MKYVGIDVDDTQYHGSAFNKDTGEALDFKCRPTLKGSAEWMTLESDQRNSLKTNNLNLQNSRLSYLSVPLGSKN